MSALLPPGYLCLGFTGTRAGMTDAQKKAVRHWVWRMNGETPGGLFAVHGDCIGADNDFDEICIYFGLQRGIYPSDIESLRARCDLKSPTPAIVLHEPAPPLVRNPWIPLACERIIATPGQMEERKRSGTSHCIRASRNMNRTILTIWPDGSERIEMSSILARGGSL